MGKQLVTIEEDSDTHNKDKIKKVFLIMLELVFVQYSDMLL